jgi:RNase P subunit RPR2
MKAGTCEACGKTIHYETLGGMLVFRKDDSDRPVYSTRCGCGGVKRYGDGRRVSPMHAPRRAKP